MVTSTGSGRVEPQLTQGRIVGRCLQRLAHEQKRLGIVAVVQESLNLGPCGRPCPVGAGSVWRGSTRPLQPIARDASNTHHGPAAGATQRPRAKGPVGGGRLPSLPDANDLAGASRGTSWTVAKPDRREGPGQGSERYDGHTS